MEIKTETDCDGNGEDLRAFKRVWTSRNKLLSSFGGGISVNDPAKIKKGANGDDDEKKDCVCELCDKSFSSKSALVSHYKTHTGERNFECSTCGKKFATKFALRRHLFCHDGKTPLEAEATGTTTKGISCDVCDRRFSTKEWLTIHMRRHTGDLPFSCEVCDKKFPSQSNLNRHALSHQEKRFLCYVCGKTYYNRHSMNLHLQSHVTERNFDCDMCRMTFKTALLLKRHRLTHLEIKRIPCPLPNCAHHFRRKDNLNRHLRLMHNQTREEAHETFKRSSADANKSESTNSDATSTTPRKEKPARVKRSATPNSKTRGSPTSTRSRSTVKAACVRVRNRSVKKKADNSDITNSDRDIILTSENQPTAAIQQLQSPGTRSDPLLQNALTSEKRTSVIRIVSSSNKQRCNQSTSTDDEVNKTMEAISSTPPACSTFISVPVSLASFRRNTSPSQEYINYLNSLNNPSPYYRLRERVVYEYPTNPNPSSSLPHSISHRETNYAGEDAVFVNLDPVTQTEEDRRSISSGYLQRAGGQIQFPYNNYPPSVDDENLQQQHHQNQRYFRDIDYAPHSHSNSKSGPAAGESSKFEYDDRLMQKEEKEKYVSSSHFNLGSSSSSSYSQQPSYHRHSVELGGSTSLQSESEYSAGLGFGVCTEYRERRLDPGEDAQSQTLHFHSNYSRNLPAAYSDNVNLNFVRPSNVTVIKHAAASSSAPFSSADSRSDHSSYEERRRGSSLDHYSPSATGVHGSDLVKPSGNELGVGGNNVSVSSPESGIIVNRDPRKNFLHRENASRNRNPES